ncbi:MAG: hypothetical protein HDQ98_09280 [Lachnospiraceae bacterium]|nr:hypothetical protein [Lachnospiraceae bacterium]
MEQQENQSKGDLPVEGQETGVADHEMSISGQLSSAVLLLEEYAKPFITEDETKMAIIMPRIAQVMSLIFPMIIHDYTLPAFAKRQEELPQWTGLLAQILETLEGRDTLAKIDMVYAVLLPNLTEHITILQEHGL